MGLSEDLVGSCLSFATPLSLETPFEKLLMPSTSRMPLSRI
jgi:hypothetical protein